MLMEQTCGDLPEYTADMYMKGFTPAQIKMEHRKMMYELYIEESPEKKMLNQLKKEILAHE